MDTITPGIVDAAQGLSEEQAAARLRKHGPNELVERGRKSPWRILWEQVTLNG